MFQLDSGLILSLYPRSELAKDANIPAGPPSSGEFSIGHGVGSKAEVERAHARNIRIPINGAPEQITEST